MSISVLAVERIGYDKMLKVSHDKIIGSYRENVDIVD